MGWAADKVYGVFYNLMKGFFFAIDNIVYGCIPTLYRLLLYLANVDLVTNNVPVEAFIRRIYIFVGVFMLFRLGISMITYIANPESFSDQTKGFTNMVKRVMIALVLLVSVPWLFKEAYVIQGKIIESNVLPALILGETRSNPDSLEESIETSAKDLQFLLFEPFFALNYKAKTTYLPGVKDNGSTSNDLVVCAPDAKTAPSLHIIGSNDMALNKNGCLEKFAELIDEESTVKVAGVTLDDFFRTTDANGVDNPDRRDFEAFGGLLSWKLSNGASGINYIPIISTICGGYVVLLLLTFCIDVAARVIRLLFLQILSPVAIISSIDPTSTGDRLREWGTECLKVWASLFLRLLVIFLLIQLTRVISNTIYSDNLVSDGAIPLSGANGITPWLYLFLILGIFTAIKKIPDLIEKATGIKMEGDLQLNPFKNAFVKGGVVGASGAALGLATGGLAGSWAAFNTARANDHSVGESLGSAAGAFFTGGASGLFRGARAGGAKGFNAGLQSGGRISRRMDAREAIGGWKNSGKMLFERARDYVGASTTFETMEAHAKRYDEVGSAIKAMNDRAVDQLSKKSNDWKGVQATRAKAEQDLKNGIISETEYVAKLNQAYKDEQMLIAEYIDAGGLNGEQDDVLAMNRKMLQKAVRDSKVREYRGKDSAGNDIYGEALVLDAGGIQTSWSDIGGDFDSNGSSGQKIFKTGAEHEALAIRSDDKYNDARDLDQAIHSARTDSHQKFH